MFNNLNNSIFVHQLPAFFAGFAICSFINVSNIPVFLADNAKTIATQLDDGTPQSALTEELSKMGERACVFKDKDDAKYVIVIPSEAHGALVETGKALVGKNIQTGCW